MNKTTIGLERGLVKLEAYSPLWADLYAREAEQIKILLGENIHTIAHVGSTSIPGIRSKPIIDIILVMRSFFELEEAVLRLRGIGFSRGEFVRDEGIFLVRGTPDFHTHYLHLVSENHQWQQYIFFRDYMVQHPESAKEYERLKLGLEDKYSKDRPLYTAAKKDFILNTLAKMPEGFLQDEV